jgi:TRAP-type C4-dicarboxylate transport system permease small subunit
LSSATHDHHEQRGLLLSVDRALARVENLFNDCGAAAIFLLMWLTIAEVLGRRLLNSPVPGAIDYIEVGMIVFAFGGIAFCQRLSGHVRMDLLLGTLKGRVLWAVEALAAAVATLYAAIIVYASIQDTWRSYDLGDSTIDAHVTVWPSKLVVPLSMGLLTLRLLVQLWGYLRLVVMPDAPRWAVPVVKHADEVAEEQIQDILGRSGDNPPPAEQR